MSDASRLSAAAFLRAVATGAVGVSLGVHLAGSGLSASASGIVVGVGLAGGAIAALVVTLARDRLGRRVPLLVLALLSAAGTALLAAASHPATVCAAAFLGMVNGMGRDRGAALVLETAALPGTVPDEARTRAFAVYSLFQDVGHALGGLVAGAPALLVRARAIPESSAALSGLLAAAVLLLASAAFYVGLSPSSERTAGPRSPLRPETRRVLAKIVPLFGLDSVAGGFLTASLLAYFFSERFGVGAGGLGLLFFAARALNAGSHLAAAWLARRIGLVNTMVFTHIPSSVLLATVPFAPTFAVASLLFLLREGLVEMDVPTRQSYVMAVVAPEDRTFASGATHLVRLAGWAAAPGLAGAMMQGLALATPLFVGAGLKVVYDVALWRAFRREAPPEERRAV